MNGNSRSYCRWRASRSRSGWHGRGGRGGHWLSGHRLTRRAWRSCRNGLRGCCRRPRYLPCGHSRTHGRCAHRTRRRRRRCRRWSHGRGMGGNRLCGCGYRCNGRRGRSGTHRSRSGCNRRCGPRRRSSRSGSRRRSGGRGSHRTRRRPALRRGLRRLRGGLRFRDALEMLAHQLGMVQVERARVRFLLGDSDLGQVIDQNFRFDLKFPRKLVNSYLIRVRHSPLFFDSTATIPLLLRLLP